ncbi:MAG: RNA polymerase subunit sigma-24 [Planctomycetes bacterium]|nr:RNA polymerase subunit sigma-24 [Planctomycetota bacterium]
MSNERAGRSDAEPPHRGLDTALYASLHDLAARQLGARSDHHTLQPTALLHEAWLRIANLEARDDRSRGEWLALAARTMRSVLVDHARRRSARKRDGGLRVELTSSLLAESREQVDILDLEAALARLAATDPELVTIVELLFFAGLTVAEAALSLDVSTRTVERGWRTARAWLRSSLATPDAGSP